MKQNSLMAIKIFSVDILCSLKRRLEFSRYFMFYRNTKLFIENNLTTPKFLLVIHGGDDGNGAELNCLKLGKKFYQLLKNRLELGRMGVIM